MYILTDVIADGARNLLRRDVLVHNVDVVWLEAKGRLDLVRVHGAGDERDLVLLLKIRCRYNQ